MVSLMPTHTQPSSTYVDKLLQIGVEVRQIISAPLVIGNELGFAFDKLQPLLLQSLSLCLLVVDARGHQCILVIFSMLGMKRKELFDRNERQLGIRVT